VKVCAYFPYPIKIWLNGHEYSRNLSHRTCPVEVPADAWDGPSRTTNAWSPGRTILADERSPTFDRGLTPLLTGGMVV
jgi:hypothetical protein